MSRFLEQDLSTVSPGTLTSVTVPKSATRITVELVGAGGAGTVSASAEGGGGGGAYSRVTSSISPSQPIYLNIAPEQATAGSAGASSLVSFNSNGSSPFGLANGGGSSASQTGGAGGDAVTSIGDVKVAGGAGGTGQGGGGSRAGSGGGSSGTPWLVGQAGTAGSGATPGVGGNTGIYLGKQTVATLLQFGVMYYTGTLYIGGATAGGGATGLYSSTDGLTWTRRQVTTFQPLVILWTGTTYVSIGSTGTNEIYTSTNGTAWTLRTAPSTSSAIKYADCNTTGLVVGISNGNEIIYSTDNGATWTLGTSVTGSPKSLVWHTGTARFYLSVQRPSGAFETYSTTNGTTFTLLESPTLIPTFYSLGGTLFKTLEPEIGTSNDLEIYLSTNGTTWIPCGILTSIANTTRSFVKTTSYFALVSYKFTYISIDGYSWFQLPAPSFTGAYFIAIGNIVYSYDAVFDFFSGNILEAYRYVTSFANVSSTLLNQNIELTKFTLLGGGAGGFAGANGDSGQTDVSASFGAGGGGGGGGNGGGNAGPGQRGGARLHYNPGRKIVS